MTVRSTDWFEIKILLGPAVAEDIACILSMRLPEASMGLEMVDDGAAFWVVASEVETVTMALRKELDQMRQQGWVLGGDIVKVGRSMQETEWRDAWKKYFTVDPVTKNLVIVPSWEDYTAAAHELPILLDPGMAFGTGSHATTRLVMFAMQQRKDDGASYRRFLDFGSGSCVLSIAASRLWPQAEGIAIDCDDQAIKAGNENLVKNGLHNKIVCADSKLADIEGPFDLVIANIRSSVLIDSASQLQAICASKAIVLLSGILLEETDVVAEAFNKVGMTLLSQQSLADKGDWVAMVYIAR